MPTTLTDQDWSDLITLIREGKCTPVIGAGACDGVLPLGREVAEKWSAAYGYPLQDTGDLARVAQFLAISKKSGMWPKDDIRRQFQGVAPPDFSASDEPHALLADLNLPIYITTNYDSFMVKALENRKRTPVQEFCRWNDYAEVKGMKSVFKTGYTPTPANPLVYHLHGYLGLPQSMVLTEGDYLDFLIRLSSDPKLLPPPIREALVGSTLIFVGYRLADWNFRVILRGLVGSLGASLGYLSVAVQLPLQDMDEVTRAKAEEYLSKYIEQIGKIQVQVFWGEARKFATELRARLGNGPHG